MTEGIFRVICPDGCTSGQTYHDYGEANRVAIENDFAHDRALCKGAHRVQRAMWEDFVPVDA